MCVSVCEWGCVSGGGGGELDHWCKGETLRVILHAVSSGCLP